MMVVRYVHYEVEDGDSMEIRMRQKIVEHLG